MIRVILLGSIPYLVFGFFGFIWWLSGETFSLFGIKWDAALLILIGSLLYTIASLRMVEAERLGVILFYGKPLFEVSNGLKLVPIGILQLKTETRLIIQMELPNEPENIFREDGIVPEGMSPAFRVPFAYGDLKSDDPLEVRVTAELVIIIRFQVKVGEYITFLTTIGDIDQARKQMADAALGRGFRDLTKISVAKALDNLHEYSLGVEEELRRRIDDEKWGLNLVSARIKDIPLSHGLNAAIQERPAAVAEASAVVAKAEGDKKRLTLEGEGRGAAERAVLRGRTTGLKDMASRLGVDEDAALGAETARGITDNPGQRTLIIGGGEGFGGVVSAAAALGETLKPNPEQSPTEEDK